MSKEKIYCKDCLGSIFSERSQYCYIKNDFTDSYIFPNERRDSLNKNGVCAYYKPTNWKKFKNFIVNLFKKGDNNGINQSPASRSKITDRKN